MVTGQGSRVKGHGSRVSGQGSGVLIRCQGSLVEITGQSKVSGKGSLVKPFPSGVTVQGVTGQSRITGP